MSSSGSPDAPEGDDVFDFMRILCDVVGDASTSFAFSTIFSDSASSEYEYKITLGDLNEFHSRDFFLFIETQTESQNEHEWKL